MQLSRMDEKKEADAKEPPSVVVRSGQGGQWKVAYDRLRELRVDESRVRSRALRNFYNNQNAFIDMVLKQHSKYARVRADEKKGGNVDPEAGGRARGGDRGDPSAVRIAISGSFILNIVLFVLKILLVVQTMSLTVIASAVDSGLDLLSGYVLYATQKLISSSDPYTYPQGRRRLEPVGIIIFACIMGMASLQIFVEGLKAIAVGFTSGAPEQVQTGPFLWAVLSIIILSKLIAYYYCNYVDRKFSSASAGTYAQDHWNDVLTNSFGAGALALAGAVQSMWFMDAAGGIGISVWIMYSWFDAAQEQIRYLTGRAADPMVLQKITHLALMHHKDIEKIDTVRAYHFGEGFLVEVDIVLPESMQLKQAHDIGEALQHKLEDMEEVERAFVHLDYEWDHSPEH